MNGEYTVASRVVFLDGKPAPKLYRKFNIKSVDGIDDYASMKEVLYRRFLRLEEPGDSWSMPDLVGRSRFILAKCCLTYSCVRKVVIDGGPGQLNAAIEGILDAGVGHVPTCALAKKHEHVFVPGRQDPVNDAADSPGVLFLRAIRDESHRFAVKSHRSRRSLLMNQQST
jgi:excinuclease ABC subunit C